MIDEVHVRPFEERDRTLLAEILQFDVPNLWRSQFQTIHGHPRSTTYIATYRGAIIGAGSWAENRLHATRVSGAIDVIPAYRRRGVGGALLSALRYSRHGESRPFATKLFEHMTEGMAFAISHGGEPYQTVPGFHIAPEALLASVGSAVAPVQSLAGIESRVRHDMFAQLYGWTHAAWSPVSSVDLLRDISLEMVNDCDPELSCMITAKDGAVFVAYAFVDGGTLEVVCESVDGRPVPPGDVRAALGYLARASIARGISMLWFDSHVTDPNVHPILASIDGIETEPLFLMSIPC